MISLFGLLRTILGDTVMWFKKHFESFLIRVAAWILLERNVSRSPVISRQDNNAMFEMAYELREIDKRIRSEYNRNVLKPREV